MEYFFKLQNYLRAVWGPSYFSIGHQINYVNQSESMNWRRGEVKTIKSSKAKEIPRGTLWETRVGYDAHLTDSKGTTTCDGGKRDIIEKVF